MKLGAQFYTLRDNCQDLNGLSESLKKVADIGYTTVQISGVCPYEPEWMRDELKKNGLECALTHWGAPIREKSLPPVTLPRSSVCLPGSRMHRTLPAKRMVECQG